MSVQEQSNTHISCDESMQCETMGEKKFRHFKSVTQFPYHVTFIFAHNIRVFQGVHGEVVSLTIQNVLFFVHVLLVLYLRYKSTFSSSTNESRAMNVSTDALNMFGYVACHLS